MGIAAVIALAGACSDGDREAQRGATPPEAAAGGSAASGAPQPSAGAALEELLGAEREGDHARSYRVLTSDARRRLTPSAWARRRSEVADVTGFSVEREDDGTVVAVVEHEPGLDPFVGLRPARERQTWRARREGGGWLLEPFPVVEALHPAADQAPPAALAWARAAQACDAAGARAHQALDQLFGSGDAPAALCGGTASLATGGAERLAAGPSSQEVVGQYGVDALQWARTVAVTGGPRPFHVVLAPIGSVWRVIGVFEP